MQKYSHKNKWSPVIWLILSITKDFIISHLIYLPHAVNKSNNFITWTNRYAGIYGRTMIRTHKTTIITKSLKNFSKPKIKSTQTSHLFRYFNWPSESSTLSKKNFMEKLLLKNSPESFITRKCWLKRPLSICILPDKKVKRLIGNLLAKRMFRQLLKLHKWVAINLKALLKSTI